MQLLQKNISWHETSHRIKEEEEEQQCCRRTSHGTKAAENPEGH